MCIRRPYEILIIIYSSDCLIKYLFSFSLLMNEESRTRLLDVLRPIVDQLRGSDNINQGSQVLLKTFDSF